MESTPSITVFRGFPERGCYVWSPFVNKLEAQLRISGIKYIVDTGSMSKSPTGKVPYISLSEQDSSDSPKLLSDSKLIIERLVEDGSIVDANASLSPTDKATDLAFRALLEEKLYFYKMYECWHDNYYTMRSGVLKSLPYPVQIILGLIIYRKSMTTLYGQGTSRYAPEEIAASRLEILESFESLLEASRKKVKDGKSIFWALGRKQPTWLDASLFGFITAYLVCDPTPETQKVMRSMPALMDYAERIHNKYFPDYEHW